jgi:hypothetical protein
MRKEYDFTKARKNPYAALLKKQTLPAQLRCTSPQEIKVHRIACGFTSYELLW